MIHFKNRIQKWISPDVFVVFLLSCVFFFYNIFYLESTDLNVHILFAEEFLRSRKIPFPPLYYLSIASISYLYPAPYHVNLAAMIVLSFGIVFKLQLAKDYVSQSFDKTSIDKWIYFALLITIFFFVPIYIPELDGSRWYVGKFTGTIWHNSTTIFVLPFCMLLFFSTIQWVEKPTNKTFLMMLAWSVLIALIKPSYLFAFIPAFPLLLLIQTKRINKKVILSVLFSFILILLVGFQTLILFTPLGQLDIIQGQSNNTNVVIAILQVWKFYAYNKVSAFFTSLGFPLLALWVYRKNLIHDAAFLLAILQGVFAILIFFIFAEDGERFFHANFSWQIPICYFLLNLVLMKKIIQDIIDAKGFKNLLTIKKVLLIYFLIHGLYGIMYFLRYIFFDNYS